MSKYEEAMAFIHHIAGDAETVELFQGIIREAEKAKEYDSKFQTQASLNCTLVEQNCKVIQRNNQLEAAVRAVAEIATKDGIRQADLDIVTEALNVASGDAKMPPLGARPPARFAWQMGRTAGQILAIIDTIDTLLEGKAFANEEERLAYEPDFNLYPNHAGGLFDQMSDGTLWLLLADTSLPKDQMWVQLIVPPLT